MVEDASEEVASRNSISATVLHIHHSAHPSHGRGESATRTEDSQSVLLIAWLTADWQTDRLR